MAITDGTSAVGTQVTDRGAMPYAGPVAATAMPGNTLGRFVCLTMFTPVRPQWLMVLKAGFKASWHLPLGSTDVLQFNFIRFVRWAVVDAFPFNGPPQEREDIPYSHLYFESNFDGPWQHYIDAFAYVIPQDIRLVWGRGFAFPGPPPSGPLKTWIAMNSLEGGSYYCAYQEASTRIVRSALVVGDRLREFAAASRGLSPAEFKERYEEFLTGIQEHL